RQQMQQLADSYVKELERRVRQYPLQWFNFHDFWS
ncbi:MAG: lipid A biosynthesis acyltransferase, partial [Prevotella denticola]